MNIKNITESNFKELIGLKLFYIGDKTMPNIPFNIVGDGELRDTVKVETWEGRNAYSNRLMGRVKDSFYLTAIIEMIQNGDLTTKKTKNNNLK